MTFTWRRELLISVMEGREKWSVEAEWVFHSRKYIVSADVRDDILVVQVVDGIAAEKWRGQFEPKRK